MQSEPGPGHWGSVADVDHDNAQRGQLRARQAAREEEEEEEASRSMMMMMRHAAHAQTDTQPEVHPPLPPTRLSLTGATAPRGSSETPERRLWRLLRVTTELTALGASRQAQQWTPLMEHMDSTITMPRPRTVKAGSGRGRLRLRERHSVADQRIADLLLLDKPRGKG